MEWVSAGCVCRQTVRGDAAVHVCDLTVKHDVKGGQEVVTPTGRFSLYNTVCDVVMRHC